MTITSKTTLFCAALLLSPLSAHAGTVLAQGQIHWEACKAGYPSDISFEKHKKNGRVEVFHDKDSGSVDLNADKTIGSDKWAGKEGKATSIWVSGSLTSGTVKRGNCSGSYTAK